MIKVKICTKCNKKKSLSNFFKDKRYLGGYVTWCKVCYKDYGKKWAQKNKCRIKHYQLKHNYGITLEEYNKILKSQNHNCALCKRPRSRFKRDFDVEHNHKTGFIRGLTCSYCNHRLMMFFRDNKQLIIKMIDYLNHALENDNDWK